MREPAKTFCCKKIVRKMDRTEFEALKREADSGNSEAQYQLGMEYQKKNSGAEPNPALAKHYLQKAADQGHQEARYEYGRILENEADFLGAFEQFQKLPSTHIGARLHVARLLKKGKGVPRNYEEAARLFKSVADEDNNSFAQYQYGDCLKKGLGVPRNLEEAEKYFKEAAKGGSVVGLVGYAELLEQRGESKTAYDLYCKAANDGSTTAMYHIGKCLKRGSGVEEDPVEAAQWFKKAADHGIPESQLKYAECLASGFGVEKNPVEAARLFKQVAKHGNHKAELKYAECLASGAGVEKNPVEGAELFRKAAEGGVAEAAIRYSECLKYGIGVPKNPEEAASCFASFPDRMILGADCVNGRIAVGAWTEESGIDAVDFIRQWSERGARCCISTDVSKDGTLAGPGFGLYSRILESCDIALIASGGVSGVDDLYSLADLGMYGAIVGKAYYEGRIGLKELGEAAECLRKG